jgi:hypothetical protein
MLRNVGTNCVEICRALTVSDGRSDSNNRDFVIGSDQQIAECIDPDGFSMFAR